jgi:hypothetical protein
MNPGPWSAGRRPRTSRWGRNHQERTRSLAPQTLLRAEKEIKHLFYYWNNFCKEVWFARRTVNYFRRISQKYRTSIFKNNRTSIYFKQNKVSTSEPLHRLPYSIVDGTRTASQELVASGYCYWYLEPVRGLVIRYKRKQQRNGSIYLHLRIRDVYPWSWF